MELVLKARARDRNSAREIANPAIKIVGSKARVAEAPARAGEKAKVEATVREANKDRIRNAEGRPDRIDIKL